MATGDLLRSAAAASPTTNDKIQPNIAGSDAGIQLPNQLQHSNHHHIPIPDHYLHHLPHASEEVLEKLFNQIDRNGNGRIDIHDLSAALKNIGVSHNYAVTFLKQSDKNDSGDLVLAEFIQYVREHEKNLRLQFSHLDKNRDGKVDLEELISAFKDLGLEMDKSEAKNLLLRMDQDGSLNISYDEWRDFLLLAPSTDIHGLIKFWRHSTLKTAELHIILVGAIIIV